MNNEYIGKPAPKKNKVNTTDKVKGKSFSFIKMLSALVISGVALAVVYFYAADWGAGHQIVKQKVVELTIRFPFRIEKREPQVVVRPLADAVISEEFTPIEQRIIEKWGYRDGIMAIAIFDCGESGLNQYAVSHTGDLGIAQIHYPTWGKTIQDRFGYTSADLLADVDKNLEVAYMIWDRGDVEEGNDSGTWSAWVGYLNGGYLRCLK